MDIIEMERTSGDFGFQAKDGNGHSLTTDTSIEKGGRDYGFRPMQLLLSALGSCSGIDVISILKKQRQHIDHFNIKIAGEREKDTVPSLWKSVTVSFELHGDVDEEKANKAVTLSMEKHCSVAETLRRGGTEIVWNVKVINPEKILAQ